MRPRSRTVRSNESASALVCALTTILILSIVGAGVLMNCTTRYNATSTQVKGWKEALLAAESGGEMGFRVLRENVANPGAAFASAAGWVSPAPAPLPSANSWSLGYDPANPLSFGPDSRYRARVTVDRFQLLAGSPTVGYYRIRSTGTAQLTGLKRVGMDNRLNMLTKGDNLLRKIDFSYQHFKAAYGHGDALPTAPSTSGNGKGIVNVANPGRPEVSRRIEMVAVPIMPIEGAVKTAGRLRASGATFDSYDGRNGYRGPNPAPPYDVDAHDADMVCGSADFDATYIYGDIATNGGAARTNQASGVVDNNVVTILPPAKSGVEPISDDLATITEEWGGTRSSSTITPPTRRSANGTLQTRFWYRYSSVNDLTINPLRTANGTPIDTDVRIHVTGDVRGLTIHKGVTARLYFTGNMDGKARDYQNLNADGALVDWDYFYTATASRTGATGFTAADVGKIAYQEGSPGTYWRLTGHSPVTWASLSVSNAANVVATPIAPSWAYDNPNARGNATGLTAGDVGKLSFQRFNADGTTSSTYWRLVNHSPVTWVPAEPYNTSPLLSRANHSWFYGLTPADGSTRTIDIAPPGDENSFYGGIYAPNHDFTTRGNPDFYGCFVVKSFYTNGNNSFHFDKQLAVGTDPLDYRLASYIEDIR